MAGLIDDASLVFMRETAERGMEGTAVILSPKWGSDGAGGGTTTFSPSGTVSARLAPYTRGGGEQIEAERLNPGSELIFTFPAETEVTHKDQIVYEGGTFAVVAVKARTREVTRRVGVKEVE